MTNPGRTVSCLVALMCGVLLTTGCAAAPNPPLPAGAPTATPDRGPTALATPSLPEILPRVMATDQKPAAVPALQPMVDSITAAIVDAERVPPNVRVSQKEAAGSQVMVSWVVNIDPRDAGARMRVRQDALRILAVVKASGVEHGSVLLIATGAVLQDEKRKITDVVRAKYTGPLVSSTDWLEVAPDAVFTLCDDKPATIEPAFA